MLDEYIRNDFERANGYTSHTTVYDYVDISPYYDGVTEVYIDERDVIEMPIAS